MDITLFYLKLNSASRSYSKVKLKIEIASLNAVHIFFQLFQLYKNKVNCMLIEKNPKIFSLFFFFLYLFFLSSPGKIPIGYKKLDCIYLSPWRETEEKKHVTDVSHIA